MPLILETAVFIQYLCYVTSVTLQMNYWSYLFISWFQKHLYQEELN